MKLIYIYTRQIFTIIILVICFQNEVHSQEKIIHKKTKHGLFIGFSVGPSQTEIKYDAIPSITQLVSQAQNSFLGSLELGYFFTNYIGISTGIDYVSYKSLLSSGNYQNSFNTTDSENDAFNMRVTGSDIKELQTIDFLNIPLCVNLRLPFSKIVGFYLKGGLSMALPFNQKYTSSGVFTYKGFYPAYNDLLENMPNYGFPTDKNMTGGGPLMLKTMGLNSIASAGLDFFVSKKFQIAIGVRYNHSLLKDSNTSDAAITSPGSFQLSPDAEHINSVVGGSNNIAAQSMGAEITFRFYLK